MEAGSSYSIVNFFPHPEIYLSPQMTHSFSIPNKIHDNCILKAIPQLQVTIKKKQNKLIF